ncbi:PGN_0703 family putative restriction endonuclease [Lutimonas vermicola]|uniref:PD-(D/E)XK nuclease-like domain-containing protein n=1 Tax=Lutimonas vermicola TaxID=414288 RepID=A0ABU9L4L9_9FLAO
MKIGPQYSKDRLTDTTGFLEKARLHQSKYRAFQLEVPFDGYGNYLTEKDASAGLNFYDDFKIFQEVKKRYPRYNRPLYSNMLRSEHIGFNLFAPFKTDLEFGKKVLNDLLSGQIQSLDRLEIEYAPKPSEKYLKDKTSFDTYIEYTHIDNQKGIIGIEVKYTEHDYKLKKNSKQEMDINNKNSKYYLISERCGLYKSNTIDLLVSDKFRQVWRNQLLGESIVLEDFDKFKHFTSITMFPKGNVHFIETSNEYINMLTNNKDRFVPVTYENFLSICNKHKSNTRTEKWLKYLDDRYIIKD